MAGERRAVDMTAASFARWARSRRVELLLTQEELAERSGLSVRTVRNLESGRGGAPRLETRRLVIAALDGAGQPPPAEKAPAQLPFGVAGFTGRATELHRLDQLLDRHRTGAAAPVVISAIAGMAGVGKTALAVHWAHRVRHRFTDGQLYVDLRGFAPGVAPLRPIEALARLLRALDVPADRVPTDVEVAAGVYRTLLADRRMLVLLDNARDPAQVRPLLPGGTGNLVIITSRDQLDGLIAREGAFRLTLDAFSPDEARSMVTRVLGDERAAAEPAACVELAELCARLPLALRIAATNLHGRPELSISGYVNRVRSDQLGELAVAGDPECVVRAAFELSYLALPVPARRLFRRLGLLPGEDVTAETASVVAELGPARTAGLLGLLQRAHLVEQRAPERFAIHDLLRLYARERAAAEGGGEEARDVTDRLYAHYLDGVDAAARQLYPHLMRLPAEPSTREFDSAPAAAAWLEAEYPNLVAAVAHAAAHGPRPAAWRLADGLRGYFVQRMYTMDWLASAEAGLAAAEAEGDLCGQSAAQLSRAALYARLGDQQRAIDGYSQARELSRAAGWADGQVAALGGLGNVYFRLGRAREAATTFTEVLAHTRRTGNPGTRAAALSNLGLVSMELGRLREAADSYTEGLGLARQIGSASLEANNLANLGEAYHALGRFDEAAEHLTQAQRLHRSIGDRDSEAFTLCHLAAVHRDRGRHGTALRLAEQALALAEDAGHQRYEIDAHNTAGTVQRRLGRSAEAVEHHLNALELARGTGYRFAVATALLGLADAGQGGPRALAQVEEALRIATACGYRVPEGYGQAQLAGLHLANGHTEAAVEAAERAVALHTETGHRLGQARAHLRLAEALRAADRPEAARDHATAGRALLAELGVAPWS